MEDFAESEGCVRKDKTHREIKGDKATSINTGEWENIQPSKYNPDED